METNRNPALTEAQEQRLIRYIQERRSGFMAVLISTGGLSLFLAPMALFDYMVSVGAWKQGGEYMELFFTWLVITIAAVVMFFQGIGIRFGKGSDLDCVRKKRYTCTYETCCRKSQDTMKHPYFLYDLQKKEWICPEFLEWRNAKIGCRLLCVTLKNGKGYAFVESPLSGGKVTN